MAASPEQFANTHRLFEAWNRGDYETWIEGFATDCEWYPSTVGGVEGHSTAIRGHEELWAFVRQAEEVWELFRVEVDDDLRRGNLRLLLGRRALRRGRGRTCSRRFSSARPVRLSKTSASRSRRRSGARAP